MSTYSQLQSKQNNNGQQRSTVLGKRKVPCMYLSGITSLIHELRGVEFWRQPRIHIWTTWKFTYGTHELAANRSKVLARVVHCTLRQSDQFKSKLLDPVFVTRTAALRLRDGQTARSPNVRVYGDKRVTYLLGPLLSNVVQVRWSQLMSRTLLSTLLASRLTVPRIVRNLSILLKTKSLVSLLATPEIAHARAMSNDIRPVTTDKACPGKLLTMPTSLLPLYLFS